ncbi:hypothetical protein [Dyadobacter sp. CY323]|uniref:hypothetical protein n=1 Tax=Dyadobacter sp. CY323 TaxID=2907302 RepID=UPI001F2EDEE8|nr:hypothetical protein [Dyadobacter sp. CY323]MCE6988373.1 hypothetical protein [Dyadobacter sp. CY323]
MNRKFFTSLIMQMLCLCAFVNAQSIPTTNASQTCEDCLPPGWTLIRGQTQVSSKDYMGGLIPWDPAIAASPTTVGFPTSNFLSFFDGNFQDFRAAEAYTTISGLVPGTMYKFTYHIIGPKTALTEQGSRAIHITLTGGAQEAQVTEFNSAVGYDRAPFNVWCLKTLSFIASGTTATLSIEGAAGTTSFVGISIAADAIRPCNAEQKLFSLDKTMLSNVFPSTTVDLNDSENNFVPASLSKVWYDNPIHSGNKIVDPVHVGTPGYYYAFLYDNINNCYNTDLALDSVKVEICNAKAGQVALNNTNISNVSVCTSVNLNSLFEGTIPEAASLVWFNNSTHYSSKVSNPEKISKSGTYFAFFWDEANNCYNTDNSTSSVTVTITKTEVPLLTDSKSMNCPENTINLNKTLDGLPPTNTSLRWFNNAAHAGEKIETPATVKDGTYYAFFYDSGNECYNTENSISKVTVAAPALVTLSQRTIETVCPVTTVNLNAFVTGQTPTDGALKWFTDPNHNAANEVQDPTNASAGEYYAFYSFSNCYNIDLSTSKVTVTSPNCASISQLNIRIALEGALSQSGTTMRNDLQKHFHGVALLPIIDPYGSGAQYGDIGNVNGLNGQVVDWVRVEIRKAGDIAAILETKSFLLKTDGSLVQVDGSVPKFNSQSEPIHIVVKHRNHLAVMSNPIMLPGGGAADYDFTSSLSQALRIDPSVDPPQMVIKNGVHCLWAGDVNQDLILDVLDIPKLNSHVKNALNGVLDNADLNLDGKVDNSDAELFNKNFKQDINFTLYHN